MAASDRVEQHCDLLAAQRSQWRWAAALSCAFYRFREFNVNQPEATAEAKETCPPAQPTGKECERRQQEKSVSGTILKHERAWGKRTDVLPQSVLVAF